MSKSVRKSNKDCTDCTSILFKLVYFASQTAHQHATTCFMKDQVQFKETIPQSLRYSNWIVLTKFAVNWYFFSIPDSLNIYFFLKTLNGAVVHKTREFRTIIPTSR